MSKNTPLVRKNDLVIQELDNEILIYDLKTNKVFGLNETSALVWQLSTGDKNILEIAQIISQKLKIPLTEEFVWLALEQMKKQNLLENESAIESHYQGASRREVIRRVGLASMVALPMISSLIAPSAVQAQSSSSCGTAPNIALGCSCVVGGLANSGNCASGCCGSTASPPTPTSQFCVTAGLDSLGSPCRASCECAGGAVCGFGFVCTTPASKAPGASCRVNLECISNACSGTCS